MNDTDFNLSDDTDNPTDTAVPTEDQGTSNSEDVPSDSGGTSDPPADPSPSDEGYTPDESQSEADVSPSDEENGASDPVSDPEEVDGSETDTGEGDENTESGSDGEAAETGEGEAAPAWNEELVQHIDETLSEHSSAFDTYVKSTVSGNGINVNLDDYTMEMLELSVDNQVQIMDRLDYTDGLLLYVFTVLAVDYLSRQAKRIIKNFMKGDENGTNS